MLEKRDFVAAMGLLVQWLSESEQTLLSDGEASFHRLSQQWLMSLLPQSDADFGNVEADTERWTLAAKFFDYLEANAGDYWEAPHLAFAAEQGHAPAADDDEDEDDDQNRFDAAYEGVTYLDTTDDGVEGATLSGGHETSDYELELESSRLRSRLAFLRTLARLRMIAAINSVSPSCPHTAERNIRPPAAWPDSWTTPSLWNVGSSTCSRPSTVTGSRSLRPSIARWSNTIAAAA